MKLGGLIAALAVLLAASAAGAAPASLWVVDKTVSAVRFSSSFGGEPFTGVFRRWDADIRFDPANLAGSSVTATIEVASAVTGNPDRDQALPTAAFFVAAAFPKATYLANVFKAVGPNQYQGIGELTLRGVRKPLTLPFRLVITGPQAKMNATVVINRLAFGVGQNEWKATTTLPAPVNVNIVLTVRRAR